VLAALVVAHLCHVFCPAFSFCYLADPFAQFFANHINQPSVIFIYGPGKETPSRANSTHLTEITEYISLKLRFNLLNNLIW